MLLEIFVANASGPFSFFGTGSNLASERLRYLHSAGLRATQAARREFAF